MHCVQKIAEDIFTLGGCTRRIVRFENIFSVPAGMSFNSYFLNDEKITVFDTVDVSVLSLFQKNLEVMLAGRSIDYLVVTHAEPDHSAFVGDLLERFPDMQVVCTEMCKLILQQFLGVEMGSRCTAVHDGSTLCTGRHTLAFYPAPMVHWPEVMMVFDKRSRVLFSADAFGSFGALDGAVFSDCLSDYAIAEREMRRYYAGIISKFGSPVHRVLDKLITLPIAIICPLHGPCYRRGVSTLFARYSKWSDWQPEQRGVVIITGSVYGHTEWYAERIAAELVHRGIPVVMYDASCADVAAVVGSVLRYSHVIIATVTYNNGVFPRVEHLVTELVARNVRNRTFGIVQNGSWAPRAAAEIRSMLSPLVDCRISESDVTILSSPNDDFCEEIRSFVTDLGFADSGSDNSDVVDSNEGDYYASSAYPEVNSAVIQQAAFRDIQYGLFVLTARCDGRDNGCIVNTVMQITETPERCTLAVAVDKKTLTCDMILNTGVFTVSALTEEASIDLFRRFGFQSGRTVDKFSGYADSQRVSNGLLRITDSVCAFISAKTFSFIDCGTHVLFAGDVTEAVKVSDKRATTYRYYFEHIRSSLHDVEMFDVSAEHEQDNTEQRDTELNNEKSQDEEMVAGTPHGPQWRCTVCGYIYDGESIPEGYRCPVCGYGAEAFERI